MQNKNKQSIFLKTLMILLVAVFVFSANAEPAQAVLGVGDISFTNVITDIPSKLLSIFNKIRSRAGANAFHQALRSVTYRLAQQSAVWLASGDKGKKPLIFQKPLGKALEEIGDEVGGKFLANISSGTGLNVCSPSNVDSRLKLTIGVSKSIQDFDIFLDNEINRDTGKAGCKLTDIGKNFNAVYQDQKKALNDLADGFSIDNNELGAFIRMQEYVQNEKKKAEEQEKLERTKDAKAVKTTVSEQTLTTAGTVEEVQKSATRKAIEQEVAITGDIFVDAFQIFANTFAQTYLKRLQAGLLRPSTSRSPGGLNAITGSPASKAALLAEYNAFSPERALNLGTPGEIDLFADMSSCPPNEYQNPYNCLLSENLQQAVQQELTVSAAVEAGLIDRNMLFPEKHVSQEARLSEQNLKKLRFLRVIPVGWEIAANRRGTGDQVRFSELLRCFSDASEQKCADIRGLVDPGWILSLPQQFCKAQGYSDIPEHEKSPNRQQVCVDLQSCIKEDSSGRCIGYGYCSRERNTWQISGDSCDSQFATCQTFTKPDRTSISVLTSSIDENGCDSAEAAGCAWYSTKQTDPIANVWDDDPNAIPVNRIYLNSSALSCSASDAGAQEVIILDKGVNIIKNGDFVQEVVGLSRNRSASEGGWQFANLGDINPDTLEYLSAQEAIKPNMDVEQEVRLKPYTYYTLSFDARQGDTGAGALVEVEAMDDSRIVNVSFPLDQITHLTPNINEDSYHQFRTDSTKNNLSMDIDFSASDQGRYAGVFFSGTETVTGQGTVNVKIHLKNRVIYDNVQLEEISINDAIKARAAIEAYLAGNTSATEAQKLRALNRTGEVFATPVNMASPSTSFKKYGFNNQGSSIRAGFKDAGICNAEEVSSRAYTLATDPSITKYARLRADGLCLSGCNGMDRFLAMPTPMEKLSSPSPVPAMASFIPSKINSCRQEEVGCESFTNLSQGDSERREYYSRIESCVLDTNPNIATFYTWEGGDTAGFQLKAWQLLKDSDNGPCVDYSQGQIKDPSNQTCGTNSNDSITCDPLSGALCRTFLDENGQEHVRDSNLIVTASGQCTGFRRTKDQTSWYFIPSEANKCSQSANGCREYKGKRANNFKILFEEPFEDEFRNVLEGSVPENWWAVNYDITPNIAVSSADAIFGSYSLLVEPNAGSISTSMEMGTAMNDAIENYNEYDFRGKSYELRFIAKASDNTAAITGSFLRTTGTGEEYFFKGVPRGGSNNILLTTEWREYILGPLYYKETNSERPDSLSKIAIEFTDAPSGVLIDNLQLREVVDRYYLIEQSTLPQSEGGNQPDVCYSSPAATPPVPKYSSCHAYQDAKKNTYYVERFDKLFNAKASTCMAVIDTQNSDNPYGYNYNFTSPDDVVKDNYPSPADALLYRYITRENNIALASAGCTAIGSQRSDAGWNTAYKIIDPDFFGTAMCQDKALGCKSFTSKSGGSSVFRDPGANICKWDSAFQGAGGFVDQYNAACPQNFAKACPENQNSCTAYHPTNDKLTEDDNTAIFSLANTVSAGDCTAENIEVGCVNFTENYSFGSILQSKLANPRDRILEVKQERQCAEWLAPTTMSQVLDPKSRSERTVVYDFGRCQELGQDGWCVKWVDVSNNDYPKAYRTESGSDFVPTMFNNGIYSQRLEGGKTLFNKGWDYSGYSIPGLYPIETLSQQPDSDGYVLASSDGSSSIGLSCRSYPEEDSPFASTGVKDAQIPRNLENLNICSPDDTKDCVCSYKKATTLGEPKYYGKYYQGSLPEEAQSIVDYEGWYGYCLERDKGDSNDPHGNPACSAWWPVDVVRGRSNIFDNHPEAGFAPGQPMYYCLAAKGNKLPQVAADKVSFKDNNYVLDFDKVFQQNNYFVRGVDNTEVLVRYYESGGVYEWPDASGIVKSQVDFDLQDNPFANLYEYDVESIILKPFGAPESWPEGVDFVLNREGFAKGSVGKSVIFDKEASDRWSVFWCGGNENNQCDKVFGDEYSWNKFNPVISDDTVCGEQDVTKRAFSEGKTNLFAVRAVFADENGEAREDSSFEGVIKNPYQFIGFEGGLCDNGGGSAVVGFRVKLQLREWCTDVALVSGAGGENKAWTGRLNNMSQQSSGLCQGGANNNNLCFSNSNCSGGDICNYKFDMLRDGSGKIIGGNLTGLYNGMSGGFPVPFPFNISQDNKPFGAIVPPSQKIYVPEEWDSRMNPDDPAASEKTDEEKRALEAGRQPLYVEKANKQVRAGSPYACSASASQCLFPPSKDGKIPTSWVPDQALQTLKYPLEFLNQIFAKVYKIWRWSSSAAGFGYKLIAGGTEPNPSTITNIEGQCPVVLAAEKNTSTSQLDAKQRLILDSQGDIQASDYYNVPRTGACNDGRYAVNGIPIPGTVLSPMVTANVGEEVALQFYGFNYNGEQMPLKEIAIDWGAGETETVITGSFKNHRYDCKENANYGQTSKACENSPFVFQHIYGQPGEKSPMVTIKDNWGRTTIAQYVDSQSQSIPVIDIIQINNNIDANPDISVPSGLRKPNLITFSWQVLGRDRDSITKYKIKVNVKDINGNISPIASIDQPGTSYTISDPVVLNNLALATISVQPCKASGECGRVASKTFGYPPGEVENISFSPSVPVVGDSVEFVWDRVPEAQEYQLTFISSTLTNETATTSASRYVFPYPTGLQIVRAKIEAHNSSGYGQFGLSDFVEYIPPAPTGLSFTPQNPEFDDTITVSWQSVGIANSYTYQLSINGGPWANDKTIIAPITTDDIAYIPGTTSLEIQVNAVSGTTDSAWSSPITVAYINPCGNGRVDTGESCDPAMSSIANYTITPGGNSVTNRCVPAGETKVIGSVTRTQCQWWTDEDNDGHDGELDCQNQTREANMYIGSSYQGLTRVDYNCNNNIDTAMGVCTGTGGGVARSTACPGASQSQADSWCKQYYSRSDATAVGLGGSFYCNTLDEIQCSWCSARQDKYY